MRPDLEEACLTLVCNSSPCLVCRASDGRPQHSWETVNAAHESIPTRILRFFSGNCTAPNLQCVQIDACHFDASCLCAFLWICNPVTCDLSCHTCSICLSLVALPLCCRLSWNLSTFHCRCPFASCENQKLDDLSSRTNNTLLLSPCFSLRRPISPPCYFKNMVFPRSQLREAALDMVCRCCLFGNRGLEHSESNDQLNGALSGQACSLRVDSRIPCHTVRVVFFSLEFRGEPEMSRLTLCAGRSV